MAVKKIETLNKHENPSTNTNQFDIEKYLNENWDHIKDVVDNNAEELINTQANIETSQTEIIQKLKNNLINITTDQSNIINIQDCSDFEGIIDVEGNSVQETRSGKNLTNYKDWTNIGNVEAIEEQNNNKIICSIKNNSYGVCDIERTLKANTNYTAYVKFTFTGTFSSQYGLRLNINGSTTPLKTNGLVNFTTDETGKAKMQFYVGFPYTGENATLTVSDIRLYEGTYTIDNIPDYEQYGAMPSPEYPSEIQNVEGNIDITVCNKNLISGQWEKLLYSADGTPSYLDSPLYRSFKIKLKAGTYVYSYNADLTIIRNVNLTDQTTLSISNKKFTLTKDTEISLGFRKTDNSNWDLGENLSDINFQLEKNEVATEYIAHQQQTITFPLSEGQKLYKGDYLADDGIHHKRKQFEVDGTNLKVIEVYLHTSGVYFCKVITPFKSINFSEGCSSHFKWITDGSAQINCCYITGNGEILVFALEDQSMTTIDSVNNWLIQQKQAGTPVKFECELAEEVIEPYTEEQQEAYNKLKNILPYKLVTDIFTDLALLKFNYIADTKTYIDNKFNNLSQQFLNL